MRCAAVLDGIVQSTVEISLAYKAGYERQTGMTLIEISDVMNVQTGDVYDAESGQFIRDGIDVSTDGTLSALQNRVLETENRVLQQNARLAEYEAAYNEGVHSA